MSNRVDYAVALEIASHEAVIRQAYKDSVGVWTWSVGLTSATGHDVARYIGKPQTLEHCLAVYVWALNNYAAAVNKAFKGRTLTNAQFAGALSFHWNTGAIGRASWVKLWLAGDIAGARKAFMAYNKPAEIIGRRKKELALFFDGKWSNDGKMTEFQRVTSRSTPDWGSARRIEVKGELLRIFGSSDLDLPIVDHPPKPSAPVAAPTLSPERPAEPPGSPASAPIAPVTADDPGPEPRAPQRGWLERLLEWFFKD